MNLKLELQPKEVFSRIGFSLAISFLVVNGIQLAIIAILKTMDSPCLQSQWLTWILIVISFYLIGFPLFCWMVKDLPTISMDGVQKLKLFNLIEYGCIAYTLAYVFNLFTLLLMAAIESLKGNFITNVGENLVVGTSSIGLFICGVILSPIIEEILFRKILIDKIKLYGDKVAILVSAVTFGVYHGNLSQVFYATALGAIFAYVTLKTNRVQYAIILHIFINGMSAVIMPAILGDGTEVIRIALAIGVVFTILVVGIVGLIKLMKKINLNSGTYYIHRHRLVQTIFGNGGMIGYLVISFVVIILTIITT